MPPSPPVFGFDGAVNDDFSYQQPPCIKCGSNQNTSIQNFKKIYDSPIAILGIFFGFLPYFILKILLRTTHSLTAPFCHGCWNKFSKANTYLILTQLGFFVVFVLGIVLAIAVNNMGLILLGFVASVVLYIWGNMYVKGISPKYKKVDSKQVIIDAPLVGEILFTK
ncbi:MAG TPA: hypothetical protein VNB22_15640 [Pyrinomonadaceae bacterium]|nr:hypothetical protein [Pyrinomonadaceae bacterium]